MPRTATSKQGIVRQVMREFAKKTLRSSSGHLVTDRRQAMAIALQQSRKRTTR